MYSAMLFVHTMNSDCIPISILMSSSWPPSETPIGSPVMRILNLNPRWGELLLMLCVRQNSSKWWSNSSSITTWLLIVGTGVSRKCLQWLHNVLHFINNTRNPSSVNTTPEIAKANLIPSCPAFPQRFLTWHWNLTFHLCDSSGIFRSRQHIHNSLPSELVKFPYLFPPLHKS